MVVMEFEMIRGKGSNCSVQTQFKGANNARQQEFPGDGNQGNEAAIDLNEQLVRNKKDTFFFRMNGNTMAGAGIYDQDILIVDRSVKTCNGKVVIACYNGEMIVRRLEKAINKICLVSENKMSRSEEVQEDADFEVWGVVTHSIHSL
jgi:DNA polymerase V